jgi:hypothetical protein
VLESLYELLQALHLPSFTARHSLYSFVKSWSPGHHLSTILRYFYPLGCADHLVSLQLSSTLRTANMRFFLVLALAGSSVAGKYCVITASRCHANTIQRRSNSRSSSPTSVSLTLAPPSLLLPLSALYSQDLLPLASLGLQDLLPLASLGPRDLLPLACPIHQPLRASAIQSFLRALACLRLSSPLARAPPVDPLTPRSQPLKDGI